MDGLERMNEAINYIEDNIKGDIDYEQAAKIACCPVPMSMYTLADLPAIECFYPPEHNPQNELRIPIVMKNS